MIVYELKPQFNSSTGKSCKPLLKHTYTRICDYCGRDGDSNFVNSLIITPDTGLEPWYDQDFDFLGKEQRVEIHEFYQNQPDFHYCMYDTGTTCELVMMEEWILSFYSKKYHGKGFGDATKRLLKDFGVKPLYDLKIEAAPGNIAEMCSYSRYRVVRHLLDKKLYTPEQLGIEFS